MESKSKSVLFLSYWYPNRVNRIFPVFTRKHAEAVALNNHVTVLSLSFVPEKVLYRYCVEVRTDENGIETHQLYVESIFNKLLYLVLPLHNFLLRRYIRTHLRGHQFSIIHSNVLFPCAIVGAQLARHFKLKHVITEHWSKLNSFFERSIYSGRGKKAYDSANAITCVSSVLKSHLLKHTSNTNIQIIPNVIDTNEFFLMNDITKYHQFTFIAAANWTSPKNPFYFLDALDKLRTEQFVLDFGLIMVGNGDLLDEVKKRNYPFPIKYTGILDAKQLNIELNRSHIFLHGSEFETFSTIIIEALMCGLPCVVSTVGIAPEVINVHNGFLVENTIEDWTKKIMLCYQSEYDTRHIAEEYKKIYDLETIGRLFDEVYRNI